MRKSICVCLLTALLALLGCTAAQEAPQRAVTGIEVDAAQIAIHFSSAIFSGSRMRLAFAAAFLITPKA